MVDPHDFFVHRRAAGAYFEYFIGIIEKIITRVVGQNTAICYENFIEDFEEMILDFEFHSTSRHDGRKKFKELKAGLMALARHENEAIKRKFIALNRHWSCNISRVQHYI